MNPPDMHNAVTDWKLERYVLGELPDEESEGLRRLAEQDMDLQRRLEELNQSNAQILERYPPAWVGGQIERRSEQRAAAARDGRGRWSFGRIPAWASVPALAVALLLIILPTRSVIEDEGMSQIRIKGLEPQLTLHLKTASGSEILKDGQRIRAGDVIQVAYQAGASGYGAILSVDGRGSVTWHLPAEGTSAARLQEGSVPLDFAYELDDAPNFERFYFITADAVFELELVEAALNRLLEADKAEGNSLEVPSRLRQFTIALSKGAGYE